MKLENIYKIYNEGKNNEVVALKNINITFDLGKMYAIMGRSGSGKSTLIKILGLMDTQTKGKYYLDNKDTREISPKEKAYLRNKEIGFVFQDFYLDDKLTAYENIILPLLINRKISKQERKEMVEKLLNLLDLNHRKNHYPNELSGGECQRVAIARALINNPKLLICDEPTGNLDKKNEEKIFTILKKISEKKCVIVVSHNPLIKEYADIVLSLDEGELIYEDK